MKNLKKFFTLSLLVALFFGCKTQIIEKSAKKSDKVLITLSVYGNGYGSRTAMPDPINYEDYTYSLTCTNSNGSFELFSGEEFSTINTKQFALDKGVYTFTLDAYSGAVKVLSGSQNDVDISAGGVALSFFMRQLDDLNADVDIVLQLPAYQKFDGTYETSVVKVMAGVSSNPVASVDGCDILTAVELSINDSDSSNPTVNFTSSALKTGGRQYVRFFLYDEKGDLVASITEGVVLLYGKTATSTIGTNQYTLGSYPVELRLQKNGEPWADARKIQLVNKSDESDVYTLSNSKVDDLIKLGNVPNSAYYVYVQNEELLFKNTYIVIDTAKKSTQTLDYYTVALNPGTGVKLIPATEVTPQQDGTILFLKNSSFAYKAELKPGYDLSEGNIVTKENNQTAFDKLDVNRTIVVDKQLEITTNSAHAIPYSIEYKISAVNNQMPQWINQSRSARSVSRSVLETNTAPDLFSTYIVTNDFILPTGADIKCNGKVIDGWYIEGQSEDTAFSTIKADTLHENLVLLPKWKSVEVSVEKPTAGETSNGVLGSNGISFIIVANKNNPDETNIYYDIDSDGEIDEADGDVLVTINGNSNFTGYEITADSLSDEYKVASDVTFTVKGGNLYSIKGLGKDAANKSTLNITGNPIIGGVVTTTVNVNNIDTTFATVAHGVLLNSFTDEVVNVIGDVTSAQESIILLTDYSFERGNPHYVAAIADSKYAESGLFGCYSSKKTNQGYKKKRLTSQEKNGAHYIRLENDESISICDNDERIELIRREEDNAIIGFSFGEDRITTSCSVFSISTENGTFKVKQPSIYKNANDARENGLQYLGQFIKGSKIVSTGATDYAESLASDKSYVYMHVMANNGLFTAGDASDFLKNVEFVPDKDSAGNFVEMSVAINLEVVKWDKIQAMKNLAKELSGSEDSFSYFDGHFYLGVNKKAKITWANAYTEAKTYKFNGLKGYLMNITSELENSYITHRMPAMNTWIGGARLEPGSGYDKAFTAYDPDSISKLDNKTYVTKYYWIGGPEAGEWFTDGNIPQGSTGYGTYGYPKASKSWFGNSYTPSGTRQIVTNGFTNWDKNEPNDSMNGKSEQCVHFYGTGSNKGSWNDFDDDRSNDCPQAYTVEFSEYTRRDKDGKVLSTSGVPDAAPIKKVANFNLNSYMAQ